MHTAVCRKVAHTQKQKHKSAQPLMAVWVVLRSRLLCRMFQKRGNKHFVGISIANAILSIDILSGGKLMG